MQKRQNSMKITLKTLVILCILAIPFQQKTDALEQLRLLFARLRKPMGLFTYNYNILSKNNSIYAPEFGFIPHYPQRPPEDELTKLATTTTLLQYGLTLAQQKGPQVANRAHTVVLPPSPEKAHLIRKIIPFTETTPQIPIVVTATNKDDGIVQARFCLLMDPQYKTATITSSSLISRDKKNNVFAHSLLYRFLEMRLKEHNIFSIINNTISDKTTEFWQDTGYIGNLKSLLYLVYNPQSGSLPQFHTQPLNFKYNPTKFVKTDQAQTQHNETILWQEGNFVENEKHIIYTTETVEKVSTPQVPVVATLVDSNNVPIARFIFTIDETHKNATIRSTSFVGGIERGNPQKHEELYKFIEERLKQRGITFIIAHPVMNQETALFWEKQGFSIFFKVKMLSEQ
jgi:hypothetical protein